MVPDCGGKAALFPTTHWSLMEVIRRGDVRVRQQALEQFLVRYLPALRAHLVRTRNVPRQDAEDLLQEFVAKRILERDLVSRVEPGVGRFRTFLLKSLDHFLIDQLRRQRACKRSPGGGRLVPIDDEKDEGPVSGGCADPFDIAWARRVIHEALRRMQEHCAAQGRLDLWEVFRCRLVEPLLEGVPPAGYEALVAQFRLKSPAQASNVLASAKRMYARTLRAVVAEYAADEEEIEAELRDLREILRRCAA